MDGQDEPPMLSEKTMNIENFQIKSPNKSEVNQIGQSHNAILTENDIRNEPIEIVEKVYVEWPKESKESYELLDSNDYNYLTGKPVDETYRFVSSRIGDSHDNQHEETLETLERQIKDNSRRQSRGQDRELNQQTPSIPQEEQQQQSDQKSIPPLDLVSQNSSIEIPELKGGMDIDMRTDVGDEDDDEENVEEAEQAMLNESDANGETLRQIKEQTLRNNAAIMERDSLEHEELTKHAHDIDFPDQSSSRHLAEAFEAVLIRAHPEAKHVNDILIHKDEYNSSRNPASLMTSTRTGRSDFVAASVAPINANASIKMRNMSTDDADEEDTEEDFLNSTLRTNKNSFVPQNLVDFAEEKERENFMNQMQNFSLSSKRDKNLSLHTSATEQPPEKHAITSTQIVQLRNQVIQRQQQNLVKHRPAFGSSIVTPLPVHKNAEQIARSMATTESVGVMPQKNYIQQNRKNLNRNESSNGGGYTLMYHDRQKKTQRPQNSVIHSKQQQQKSGDRGVSELNNAHNPHYQQQQYQFDSADEIPSEDCEPYIKTSEVMWNHRVSQYAQEAGQMPDAARPVDSSSTVKSLKSSSHASSTLPRSSMQHAAPQTGLPPPPANLMVKSAVSHNSTSSSAGSSASYPKQLLHHPSPLPHPPPSLHHHHQPSLSHHAANRSLYQHSHVQILNEQPVTEISAHPSYHPQQHQPEHHAHANSSNIPLIPSSFSSLHHAAAYQPLPSSMHQTAAGIAHQFSADYVSGPPGHYPLHDAALVGGEHHPVSHLQQQHEQQHHSAESMMSMGGAGGAGGGIGSPRTRLSGNMNSPKQRADPIFVRQPTLYDEKLLSNTVESMICNSSRGDSATTMATGKFPLVPPIANPHHPQSTGVGAARQEKPVATSSAVSLNLSNGPVDGDSYMFNYIKEKQGVQNATPNYKQYSLRDYKNLRQIGPAGGLGSNVGSEEHKKMAMKRERQNNYAKSISMNRENVGNIASKLHKKHENMEDVNTTQQPDGELIEIEEKSASLTDLEKKSAAPPTDMKSQQSLDSANRSKREVMMEYSKNLQSKRVAKSSQHNHATDKNSSASPNKEHKSHSLSSSQPTAQHQQTTNSSTDSNGNTNNKKRMTINELIDLTDLNEMILRHEQDNRNVDMIRRAHGVGL